jgi:hypothetical protein
VAARTDAAVAWASASRDGVGILCRRLFEAKYPATGTVYASVHPSRCAPTASSFDRRLHRKCSAVLGFSGCNRAIGTGVAIKPGPSTGASGM